MKVIFFMVLCFITCNLYAQNELKIPLYTNEINKTFYWSQYVSMTLQDTANIILPNVSIVGNLSYIDLNPALNAVDAYIDGARDEKTLRSIVFMKAHEGVPTTKLNHKLYTFVYFTTKEKYIILDKNYNQDFTDDVVYKFDKNLPEVQQIISLTMEIWYKNHINRFTTTVQLQAFNRAFGSSKYEVVLAAPATLYGTVFLDKRKYYISFFNEMDKLSDSYSLLIDKSPIQKKSDGIETPFTKGDYVKIEEGKGILLKDYDPITRELSIELLSNSKFFTGFKIGYQAPDISFSTIDSKKHRFSEYKGKYVLLDFWGTWCNPCLSIIPELVAFNQKISIKNNLIFISIANEFVKNGKIEPVISNLQSFTSKHQMTWTQAYCDGFDEQSIVRQLRVSDYPCLMLISPEGTIIQCERNAESIKKMLDSLLKL